MALLSEGKHPLEFLISEQPGYQSREVWTFGADLNLAAGTVVQIDDPFGDASPVGTATGEAYATSSFVNGQSKIGLLGEAVLTGSGESAQAVVITNGAEFTKGEITIPGGQSFTTMQPRFEAVHMYARTYGARAT